MKDPTSVVVIESPYAGDVERNLAYLEECIRDCFERGEAPFASHLLYTGALDDNDPEERSAGIKGGFLWAGMAQARVVYIDHGVSKGMHAGIEHARAIGQTVKFRHFYVYDESIRAHRRLEKSRESPGDLF